MTAQLLTTLKQSHLNAKVSEILGGIDATLDIPDIAGKELSIAYTGDTTPIDPPPAGATDFGTVSSRQTAERIWNYTNSNNVTVTYTASLSGSNAFSFVQGQGTRNVAPGSSTQTRIRFSAAGQTRGRKNATLTIIQSAPGFTPFTQNIVLTGIVETTPTAQIYLDDQLLFDEGTPTGDLNALILWMDHPYAANNGKYQDQDNVKFPVKLSGTYVLASGFGGDRHSTLSAERQRRLDRLLLDGAAEEAQEKYLEDNQEKTDEILRRFAMLETLLNSSRSEEEQLKGVRQAVTARPDLCEFSRLHAEYGGKNEFRFVWQFFKPRRAALLRILSKLKLESTSQDASFERSLAFMLENSHRQSEWLSLKGKGKIALTADDLSWIPEKWWKLVTGEIKRDAAPVRINRRQFEACVCSQMARELKSGDLCVIGSDAYSDHRNELVPMAESERTRADYGEKVGLPVESAAFIEHVRTLLTEAAQQADKTYQENAYFKIINGRPKLGRQQKKEIPPGFKEMDDTLRRKLDSMGLSLLDVLTDTMQWIG